MAKKKVKKVVAQKTGLRFDMDLVSIEEALFLDDLFKEQKRSYNVIEQKQFIEIFNRVLSERVRYVTCYATFIQWMVMLKNKVVVK